MDLRSRRKGNQTVKMKGAKGGRSKQNGNIYTGISKPDSEIRDGLQDFNKPDVVKKKNSAAQKGIKSQDSNKRKKSVEQKSHGRKRAKKEASDVPSCSSSGRDVKLSEKEVRNNIQVVAEGVKLETFTETSQRPQRDKTTTKRKKSADTKRKSNISNISSPGKPNIKKLRHKANLVNVPKEQEISLKETKSQLMKIKQAKEKLADADLSIKSRVLMNQNGAEDFKKKGKSPMKRAVEGKSSHSFQKNIMAFENSDDGGDDSEMEWEDVAEAEIAAFEKASSLGDSNLPSTSSNVEVTIQVPGKKKRDGKCSKEEIRKWVQRRINRMKKEWQICAHKAHLLVLLANGLRRNDLCNNSMLQGICLSLVLSQFTQRTVAKSWDITFLTRIATWFKNKAPNPGEVHTGHSEGTYLMRVLEKKVCFLVVILRSLGLSARLVVSLQALNIKLDDDNGGKQSGQSRTPKNSKGKQNKVKDEKQKQVLKKEQKKSPKERLLNKMKGKATPRKVSGSSSTTNKTLRKRTKVDYAISSDTAESEYFQKDKKKASGDSSSASFCNFSDDEDDFEIPSKTPRRESTSSKELKRRNLEVVENFQDIGESSRVAKRGNDIWLEVYLEKEKKWICIDGETYSVNRPEECEKHATKPIKYVVAFDNESCMKDVTARYASGWLTSTAKLRVDPEWWTDTLDFYKTKKLKRDKKEDSLLKASLLRKPLPTSITEYKNHTLYVLKRHLLKFEAIYPEAAATLGFCHGEPVYSRDCVHMLHTRERWMKEAMVVKSGETAYKIVKGRKTKRKMLENVGEITAELFGRWQTEDYVPPPVIDGKVPRNEYGNVELFKPSMLPAGACHIQVPGIHRLARKLNIEAVPAVVGFDFHGGFNHPVIDGVVVCEENKDVLLDAWNSEQEEKIKREQEKREKRVVNNWAYLVRSLRIRERLKRKYNMEDEPDVEPKTKEEVKFHETEVVSDISLSWPLNRQEGKSTRGDNGHCHVFLEANHRQDAVTGEWNKNCSCGHKEPL